MARQRHSLTGDANGDGVVNAQDLAVIAAGWETTSGEVSAGGGQAAAVPEPTGIVLMAAGVMMMLLARAAAKSACRACPGLDS